MLEEDMAPPATINNIFNFRKSSVEEDKKSEEPHS